MSWPKSEPKVMYLFLGILKFRGSNLMLGMPCWILVPEHIFRTYIMCTWYIFYKRIWCLQTMSDRLQMSRPI
jgi:hypothetical protein